MFSTNEPEYRERLKTWTEFLERVQNLAIQCIPGDIDGAHPYTRIADGGKNIEFGYTWHASDNKCGQMPVPYHLRKFATGKE